MFFGTFQMNWYLFELQKTIVIDLLLLSDGSVLHYLLINDMEKMINFIRKRAPKIGMKFVEDAFIRALL